MAKEFSVNILLNVLTEGVDAVVKTFTNLGQTINDATSGLGNFGKVTINTLAQANNLAADLQKKYSELRKIPADKRTPEQQKEYDACTSPAEKKAYMQKIMKNTSKADASDSQALVEGSVVWRS